MRIRRQQTPRVFGQNWNSSFKNIYQPWFVIYEFFTFKFQTKIYKNLIISWDFTVNSLMDRPYLDYISMQGQQNANLIKMLTRA